jgi:hypothetical protein
MMQLPSGARVTALETDDSAAPMLGALFEGVTYPRPHGCGVRGQPFREGLLERAAGLGQVQGPLTRRCVGERRRRGEVDPVVAARGDERGGHIGFIVDPVYVVQLFGEGQPGTSGDQEVGS